MVPSLPLLSCESSVSVKENPDRKKKIPLSLNPPSKLYGKLKPSTKTFSTEKLSQLFVSEVIKTSTFPLI